MTDLSFPSHRRFPAAFAGVVLVVLMLLPGMAAQAVPRTSFDIDYRVAFVPAEGVADVRMTHTPASGRATRLTIRFDPRRYSQVRAEGGSLGREGARWTWVPDARRASTLRWRHRIDNKRRGDGYDARITRDWVIVRGDDLVPAMVARTTRGADSRARLYFDLPPGWTNVDTPFLRSRDGTGFVVANPERRFDRPVGWMIAGDVGTRRERIGELEVSVAGPKGDDVRRNDPLAFINLIAPEMRRSFGPLPRKILIVSAGDPMWRGGLSAPRSLYLHADRPLIGENGTSTLVHELVHVATRIRGADGDDWIAEGSAEYYSVVLTNRVGLLSDDRRDRVFAAMQAQSRRVRSLLGDRSHGPKTARAVLLFRDLDREIRRRTGERKSLDDVMQRLVAIREVSREDLADVVEDVMGRRSDVLQSSLVN